MPNKEIVFCGTGEFAREVYCWIRHLAKCYPDIIFKGFLDRDDNGLREYNLQELYLGYENDYQLGENDYIIVPVAENEIRKSITAKLKERGAKFFNLVHPSAILGAEIKMGEGNIICPQCVFTTHISIGDSNIFNINVTIGHDAKIGSYNTINSHSDITGNCQLGDLNFFGSGVSVLPSAKIGDNNKIGAGSVVLKGIKSNCLYMGNPARKMGSSEN